MTTAEELARADRLVSEGMDRVLRLSANLDRAGARGLPDFRLSLQVLAALRESLHLMVRHRDFIKREVSRRQPTGGLTQYLKACAQAQAAGNNRSNSAQALHRARQRPSSATICLDQLLWPLGPLKLIAYNHRRAEPPKACPVLAAA